MIMTHCWKKLMLFMLFLNQKGIIPILKKLCCLGSMYYVNLSLFLSIATLYPDMQMIIFAGFIPLPVKAKWLAWFDLAVFAWSVIQTLLAGQFLMALMPVVALLNYFIFFGDTLLNGAQRATQQRHDSGNARHQQAEHHGTLLAQIACNKRTQ